VRRRSFIALCAVATAGLATVALGLWLRSLFGEPGAIRVPSLTATLGARSVVAVLAHPDDEIKVAGLIADASARGVTTRLITAARGDGGIADDVPRAELASIRARELRSHASALGLTALEQWSYGDGELSRMPERELVDRLVSRLRADQPDLVLTFEPHSGYTGHADHLRIGAVATAAFCAVGDAAPRWLVYILAPRRVARRFGGARGRFVAEREPAPQYVVHVDPAIKVRGWEIHHSQRDYVRRHVHLPAWLLYRLFDDEHYLVRSRAEACS
jgi:LmbE family N-acetylglucosaminyl deacetylase